MKRTWPLLLCAFLFGTKCLAVRTAAPVAREELPSADEVLQKVIARAKWAKAQNFQQFYSFTKSTLTEELDDRGNVKAKREKSQRVPARGEPGPAREEKAAEGEKLLKEVQNAETKPAGKKRWVEVDEETLSHFKFTPLRREQLNGRPTLVFVFEPKPDAPVRQLQDRLLNKATGFAWVDEQEFEVVKADIRLKEPVAFVGGLVGAVHTFHYVFERTRVDEGVWLLARTDLLIKARQLVNLIYTKKQQSWSDFRRAIRPG